MERSKLKLEFWQSCMVSIDDQFPPLGDLCSTLHIITFQNCTEKESGIACIIESQFRRYEKYNKLLVSLWCQCAFVKTAVLFWDENLLELSTRVSSSTVNQNYRIP